MDLLSDKLSIKNILFTKAIPNFTISTPLNGHKVYGCTDCGDKFIFESSYNEHVNRKSVKISYMCRYCNQLKIFYNRCNLLNHIRSHAFKTATINVTDLKVESLPLSHYKIKPSLPSTSASGTKQTALIVKPSASPIFCYECKLDITNTGIAYKDRANHLMMYTNEVHSCPVCLFALPSICALKVHLRLHLKCPPYYCPECGINLINKNVHYPYNHDCEGFKMMRATARQNCCVPDCCLFHPNDYKEHMTKYHLKKVYKCPFCVVACFNESTMEKHLEGHQTYVKPLIFYQCDICPGRYVLQNPKLNDQHLQSHVKTTIFPCWACGSSFKDISSLLAHFIKKHNKTDAVEAAINAVTNDNVMQIGKSKGVYRVVKRCEQCRRSFAYRCKYDEIQVLPNECPYKCTSAMESDVTPELTTNSEDHITCHLCQAKVSQDWVEIKKHYADLHKSHKCLDAEILIPRIDVKKYLHRKKINRPKTNKIQKILKKNRYRQVNKSSTSSIASNELQSTPPDTPHEVDQLYTCNICSSNFDQKSTLENHLLSHRDPCMAYQCMECGQSFVVKPSFSKHLLIQHDITDVENYVKNKNCYNENALTKYQNPSETTNEPLRENQCGICRDEFDCSEDLEKHFRMHGMAFLMKNTANKNNIDAS